MICEQLAVLLVEATADFRWTIVLFVDVKDALQIEATMKLRGRGFVFVFFTRNPPMALTPM